MGLIWAHYLQDWSNHRFFKLSGDGDVMTLLYILWEKNTIFKLKLLIFFIWYLIIWVLQWINVFLCFVLLVFFLPRLSASFLRLTSSASWRSCSACWAISSLATLDVMIKMASLHSMVFPLPSVRRPCEWNSRNHRGRNTAWMYTSQRHHTVNIHVCVCVGIHTSSKSCSMIVRTSGWALSTSSNRTTALGHALNNLVSWPPSSCPTYPGGEPMNFATWERRERK